MGGGTTDRQAWSRLVRKKAGEGFSEVADGLGLRLFLAVAPGARDPTEEGGVAEGVEGIGQGLRLTGEEEREENEEGGRGGMLGNLYIERPKFVQKYSHWT